ncbi:DNA-binding transcriptional LysR family regulator [Alteromonadaceae bacterium 2753L.S.0a.02]|nr:DNA-binding transcriptional LysR family regulator [Alteromonadaceae bacterium 2753L.S.0a.02]
MKFTLKQLQVFLAVAHHQNVSRAADELAMSQSAVSGALKDLEQRYDIQLFDRVGKRLQLNELGLRLRPRCEALVASAAELESDFYQHRNAGELRVGATLTVGNYLCVALIQGYMKQVPTGRVKLDIANTHAIVEEILDFKIDLGMIEGEIHHPDLHIRPWRDDELICFCSPQHPFAGRRELDDEYLQRASWILREQGSGTRQTFDRAMHGLLPNLEIRLELQHTEAIKRAVAANMGIGCLSKISLADAFARGDFVPLKTPHRDLTRKLFIVLHKNKYLSDGILQWLSICGHQGSLVQL